MQFRAVAFDVDGTLYPNGLMYLASIPFFFSRIRLILHFRKIRRTLRQIRPIEDFYELQSHMLAEALGVDPFRAAEIIDRRIYRDWERVLSAVPRFRGIRSVIESLREAGVKVGVLSDFPLGNKLGRLGLEGLWDVRVAAEDVGYLKPNPEPFRELLARLGEAAEDTLYVGNNYAYDVEGARAVGMRTAYLSPLASSGRPATEPGAPSGADFTFYNYRRLQKWIFESRHSVPVEKGNRG